MSHGVTIQSTAREAKRLSALVSATRTFEPTGVRGQFFIEAADEVRALHDADFLAGYGVKVVEAR